MEDFEDFEKPENTRNKPKYKGCIKPKSGLTKEQLHERRKLRDIKEEKEWEKEFKFDQYDDEETAEENPLQSIEEDNKPVWSNLRSRYSPHFMELERIERIKLQVSKLAIRAARNTQDISELWDFYGCLNEYWASWKDIYGYRIIGEMDQMFEVAWKQLLKYNDDVERIPPQIHKYLLKIRDKCYMLAQRKNLGFELDFSRSTISGKGQKGIIQ